LTASETPATGAAQDITSVAQWSSSDTGIATVSGSGLVKAIAAGAATITASYQGVSSTWVVAVTSSNAVVASVLVAGSASIGTKEGTQFAAIATLFGGGGTQDVTTLATWQSSNPRVATVSNTGIVTAVGPGTATISAKYMGTTGSSDVAVVDAVSSVLLFGPTSLTVGTTTPQPFTAAAVMTAGPERVVTNVATWSSSDPGVATVSDTATYNGVAGTADVEVH